ncbi:MAG: hypothetical protein EZS28_018353 [Streblomastix strix]|uniref:Uncharacterized protein n=1 Tax=Streblomastix strix TaxID=222440 RepID=A0A5J4VU08_9EUKA|nr:MAG: hypothetical protein EZS28_018353 [Streblomastix strix]
MHDYSSWFNYDEKEYGVLASNNRRIFTGVDGKERKPVQLSTNIVITIPEPEPETETEVIEEEIVPTKPLAWYKRLPWWVFLLIGIGILLLLLSLLCCCCCFCCGCCCCGKDNSEEKDKENEKLREYNQEQENQQSNQTEMYNIAETDQSKADYSYKKSAAQPQQDEIAKRITKEPYQELSIQQPPINLSADNPFEFKTSQVQPLDQNTQPPRPHSQQGLSSGNPSSSTQYPRRSPGPNSQQRRSPGPNQQHGHSPGPNQQHGNPSSSSQYPRRSPGPNQQNGPRQPHGYKSGPKQQQRGRPPAQKDHSGASPPDQI